MPKSDLDALVGTGTHDGVARVSAKRRLLGGNRLQGFEASLKQCYGMKVRHSGVSMVPHRDSPPLT